MNTRILTFFMVMSSFLFHAQMDHSAWNSLLNKHVSSAGKVNYKGFKADKAKLEAYIKDLESNVPKSSESMNAKKAFWVNSYNAYTIKLIVDNYPVRSINDIKVAGTTPWLGKFIKIGGETMSLNDIENEKLRKPFNDPRLHFVINCASFSCPILLNKALTAQNIEGLLESQTKVFLNDDTRNDISSKTAQISSIFNWYKSDFGDVKTFINKYSKTKISASTKITYMPYSWDLNE